jgi:hypothetical protein
METTMNLCGPVEGINSTKVRALVKVSEENGFPHFPGLYEVYCLPTMNLAAHAIVNVSGDATIPTMRTTSQNPGNSRNTPFKAGPLKASSNLDRNEVTTRVQIKERQIVQEAAFEGHGPYKKKVGDEIKSRKYLTLTSK